MINLKVVKKNLITVTIILLALVSLKTFAQVSITYSPASSLSSPISLTQNVAMSLTPNATGVTAFGYTLTGFTLTGTTLLSPWGIGIAPLPSGNIYVVNYTNASNKSTATISQYDASGNYQTTYGSGSPTGIIHPAGIVFDSNGNGYVLDEVPDNSGNGNSNGNYQIEQYNSAGVYQTTIRSGLGAIAGGIAIDASGNLYVALGTQISEYTTGGQLVQSIPVPTGGTAVGVGVDGSYNIYMLDNTNNDVIEYNSTGGIVKTVLTSANLNNPNAFYVDGAGDVYVGNSGNGKVTIYNPSPSLVSPSNIFTLSGFSDPRGLATDSKGYLYVSDYILNTVKQYKPTGGYFIDRQLPPGLSFDSTTGVISGTPTSGFNATTYTVTAYGASGSVGSTMVTLYCPAILSIAYNPSINVYTIGTQITNLSPIPATTNTYSISPTLPGGLNFNIAGPGVISGTPNAASPATIYTITVTNGVNTATTTISIAVVKDNFWTGSSKTSPNWNDNSNWNAGHVPTSGELASIGVVAYKTNGNGQQPVVNVNTQAYNVTFGAAVTPNLTVQSGATLTINEILTINTNAKPTFVGSGKINLIPSSVLYINGNLTATDKLITLQSSPLGSASVGALPSGASITGAVNVERYLKGLRGYVLLSSPVNAGSNNAYSIYYPLNSTYVSGSGFPGSSSFPTTPPYSEVGNPSMFFIPRKLFSF